MFQQWRCPQTHLIRGAAPRPRGGAPRSRKTLRSRKTTLSLMHYLLSVTCDLELSMIPQHMIRRKRSARGYMFNQGVPTTTEPAEAVMDNFTSYPIQEGADNGTHMVKESGKMPTSQAEAVAADKEHTIRFESLLEDDETPAISSNEPSKLLMKEKKKSSAAARKKSMIAKKQKYLKGAQKRERERPSKFIAKQQKSLASAVTGGSTDSVIDQDLALCFVKVSAFWEIIESHELFRRFPQKPHFRPLEKQKEVVREGQAMGKMVEFYMIVEGISMLKTDDPRIHYEGYMEMLGKFELHGFDIAPLRSIMNQLLYVRSKKLIEQKKLIDQDLAWADKLQKMLIGEDSYK